MGAVSLNRPMVIIKSMASYRKSRFYMQFASSLLCWPVIHQLR